MTEPEQHAFAPGGGLPNSRLPLLVYRAALPPEPSAIERAFADHGWSNGWRNGVFAWHHFHPNAHEVLGIAAGGATVLFGGPQGREIELRAGDVVVIPAGVGHCRVAASPDLLVVGAYPGGADYDTLRADPTADGSGSDQIRREAAAVPIPASDPVAGTGGPLPRIWR